MWRRPIGPGWSSFAVNGDLSLHAGAARRRRDRRLLQGDHRRAGVAASRRDPVLGIERRRRSARDADAQQRSRLHASARTGILNVLDAGSGAVVWSRNAATDASAKIPMLGLLELAAGRRRRRHRRGGRQARGLRRRDRHAALDRRRRAASYSSPHLVTIDGVAQVLLHERTRRDQRRAGRRHGALGARVGRAARSCSRR